MKRSTFAERKAERREHFLRYRFGWRLVKCGACNGSGRYDNTGSPPCGACNGSGRTREKHEPKRGPRYSLVTSHVVCQTWAVEREGHPEVRIAVELRPEPGTDGRWLVYEVEGPLRLDAEGMGIVDHVLALAKHHHDKAVTNAP